jgi:hypothetical protein
MKFICKIRFFNDCFFLLNFQCIAIVVMFALASANAGLVSYAGLPYPTSFSQYSYGYSAGIPVASTYAAQYSSAYPAVQHIANPLAYAGQAVYGAPYTAYPYAQHIAAPLAYSAPVVYAAHATVLAKAPATYTAQTRGSIHTAPLEGHELSQTSLNVAPAPGTPESETVVVSKYVAQPEALSEWAYSAPAASYIPQPATVVATPTVYAAPATILAKAPATYTAQTLGAVHTALLEGHELSQTSLNVAPAPGTLESEKVSVASTYIAQAAAVAEWTNSAPAVAEWTNSAPAIVAAPTVYAVPATILAKAPATYTAQTLGSVHTAPLEGHEFSQTSLNVAPAPGSSDLKAVAATYLPQQAAATEWAVPATILAKSPATYTAQTLGAVHTAPLEGHELSQTSLNVAPAPGTW